MSLLTCWMTVPGQTGSVPFPALGGTIILTELGQFSKSSVVLPAANARAIAALAPYTVIEVEQAGVGTLISGYVLNPRQAIADNGDHTITVELTPLTVECTWEGTHRGWVAQNLLSVVASRLGGLAPGWSGVFTGKGSQDLTVSVSLNDGSALAGFLDTARQFGQYVRQGVDQSGVPTRVLEMGQFGASTAVVITGASGGDPDQLRDNGRIALVGTVDRTPNDVESLVNVTVPFGGGSTSDTLVTLERLWRLINDPAYPGAGSWGTPGSRFPEYDPAYPISNPRNPPIGVLTYILPSTGQIATASATLTDAVLRAAGYVLYQGAIGTRYATLDGHWDYMVYDRDSYFGTATTPAYGHKWAPFVDSSLTYTDNSVAGQELTARALYVEAVANFKRFAHPHHTFACTAPGLGRPVRAGDLVAVEYQKVGDDPLAGAVVEMAVAESLRVMSVARQFQGDAVPVDTYTLSSLGRFDATDASGQADLSRQMIDLQINQGTGLAPMTVNDTDNVDALHPMTTHVSVPPQRFQWHRCNLRVDFQSYTGTATTAQNQTQDFSIISPAQDILLDTPNDINLATTDGTTFDATHGVATSSDPIGGAPKHHHQISVFGSNPGAPTSSSNWLFVQFSQALQHLGLFSGNNTNGWIETNDNITSVDLGPTKAGHSVPLKQTVAKKFTTVARLAATTIVGTLPRHTHPLDQRIPDGPIAPSCTVTINGQLLTSGLTLKSGTRNTDGTFPGSFEIDDISQILNGITGDLTFVLTPGTSGSNQYGVGKFKLSMTLFGEFGGLTSTVRAT